MPSNPPVMPVKKEKLEEPPLDVNVSQQPRDEEPFQRVVRTWVNHLIWDHRSFPNPHALTIYLTLFLLVELRQKGLKNVNVKMTMFVFIVELGFSVMAITIGCKAQSIPFSWNIELNTSLAPSVTFWIFCSCDLFLLNRLLNCNSLEATQVKMLWFKFDFDSI